MLAYVYPQQSIFWTMLEFFLLVIWIWILIAIFSDIFRSEDLGGWGKALWTIFVILIPLLGVLVYLIARGGKMQHRTMRDAQRQQQEFDTQIRQAAGSSGDVDQLAKLAELKQQGVLTDAEFEAQKAKLLG